MILLGLQKLKTRLIDFDLRLAHRNGSLKSLPKLWRQWHRFRDDLPWDRIVGATHGRGRPLPRFILDLPHLRRAVLAPPEYIDATAIRGGSFIGSDPDSPPPSPRASTDVAAIEELPVSGRVQLAPMRASSSPAVAAQGLLERFSLLQLLCHASRD